MTVRTWISASHVPFKESLVVKYKLKVIQIIIGNRYLLVVASERGLERERERK